MAELVIETRVGRADWGENQFCGYAVHEALAGHEGWAGALALAIGRRRISAEDAALLDDAAVCTIAADPRIWPLKITRLVNSYGSVLAGFCAGHLLEEAVLGPWPSRTAAKFLVEVHDALGDRVGDAGAVEDLLLGELARGRKLPGVGVPFRPVDERLAAFAECVKRRGRDSGTYWKLMTAIDDVVHRHKKIRVNQILALAAAMLDVGFTTDQVPVLTTAMLDLCYYANAVEGAEQRPEMLRRLPVDCVDYVGREARLSPRAAARRTLDSQSPVLSAPVFR
jgi:hypothetical protein